MVSVFLALAVMLTLIPALTVGTGAATTNATVVAGVDAKAVLPDKDGDGYY